LQPNKFKRIMGKAEVIKLLFDDMSPIVGATRPLIQLSLLLKIEGIVLE